jgi:hypothetical protein
MDHPSGVEPSGGYMSAPLTAATATAGAHYLDKSNNLVLFVGVSGRHAGMYSMRVVETNRLIESVPDEYFLAPITDAEMAARKAIAAIKGQPRDVLEPKLEELDDDALDALLVADSRMWVTEAIGRVLDRRRTAKASPVITAAISPAITITAQTDVTIEEIPLVARIVIAPPSPSIWIMSPSTRSWITSCRFPARSSIETA